MPLYPRSHDPKTPHRPSSGWSGAPITIKASDAAPACIRYNRAATAECQRVLDLARAGALVECPRFGASGLIEQDLQAWFLQLIDVGLRVMPATYTDWDDVVQRLLAANRRRGRLLPVDHRMPAIWRAASEAADALVLGYRTSLLSHPISERAQLCLPDAAAPHQDAIHDVLVELARGTDRELPPVALGPDSTLLTGGVA